MSNLAEEVAQLKSLIESMQNAKIDLKKPSTFDGNRDDVETFIYAVENYFVLAHIAADRQVAFASSLLTGMALRLRVATTTGRNQEEEWPQMRNWIRATFGRPLASIQLRNELKNVQQTGALSDYIQRFVTIATQIDDMGMMDQVQAFRDGLKPATQRHVILQNPTTLDAAIKAAVLFDSAYTSVQGVNKPSKSAVIATVQPGKLKKLTEEEKQHLRQIGGCFRCRQQGHIAVHCPNNISPKAKSQD